MKNDTVKKLRYALSFWRKNIVHVNLQLLYECNFRCSICDFWKKDYRAFPPMELDRVKAVARKLRRLGPQIVSIGGGEPLMHPDIVPVVGALAERHFPVMICNGWHVTPELARDLFRAGAWEVSISVDYADPALHDRQRGMKGAFERAVNALRILNGSRARPGQRVHMISVVMEDNLDHIEPLIRLSRELGITYLVTLYSDNRGRKAVNSAGPDVSARLLELKRRYPEFVALRGYIGRFSESIRGGGISPCHAGENLINIDSVGNVTFCIDTLDEPAGNILTDPLEDILAALRRRRNSSRCSGCWTSCRGSIETLMYGRGRLGNLMDYYRMIKPVPLRRGAC